MKVKEYLYEKFVENSDPIEDMQIGILNKKTFKNEEEFVEWLYNATPYILNTDGIPPDILGKNSIISWPYFRIIDNYLLKKFKYSLSWYVDWYFLFSTFLLNKGFKKKGEYNEKDTSSPYLKESFIEDSDPIDDLGIGMMYQIKEFIKEQDEYDVLSEKEYIVTCAEWGKKEFVKYLLKTKKYTDLSLNDALDWSAEYGYIEQVEMILKAGADVNSSAGYPLRMASLNDHKDIVELLLKKGADQSYWNYTPLENALLKRNFDIADLLIDDLNKNNKKIEILKLYKEISIDGNPPISLGKDWGDILSYLKKKIL